MAEEFLIKGSSLRTKLEFASQRLNPEAVSSLETFLIQELGNRPILDADWYPFDLYDRLLHHLTTHHLDADLSRLSEVGQFSAETALASVYQSYARGRSFEDFMGRLPSFHQRLYTVSRLVIHTKETDSCEIDIVGMPHVSLADVHVSCGFFVGAARLLGHPSARGRSKILEDRVRHRVSWDV